MLDHLIRHLLLLLVFCSLATRAMGDAFDDAIEEAMADLGLRGAAITYFDSSIMQEPISRGYGQIASAEASDLVTPDTTFQLASISKTFVASAVAILVDRGTISLDDDICDVIPENFSKQMCRNPNFPDSAITWRMLMTHRSSMNRDLPFVRNEFGDWISPAWGPSNTWYTDYEDTGNPTCPLDDVVNFYRSLLSDDPDAETTVGAGIKLEDGKDLNWYELGESEGIWHDYPPGEENEYSNAAYGYLTALIELASGQSFPEFCRENLFAPLGMDTTAWFLEDLPDGTISAIPQEVEDEVEFSDIEPYCYIDYGSGSLHTTANDLVKWGNAMLTYGTQNLWSRAVGREISQCQERDENNEPLEDDDCEFGYGWILLNNDMKERRSRRLTTTKRNRRRLGHERENDDEEENEDATFAPSFSDSSSASAFTSFSDSSETSTFPPSFSESSETSTFPPSFSDSSEMSFSESSEDSWSMWEEESEDSWSGWDEDRFENYDWSGGIMHDGSDAGVSTNIIILPKAGVYVAVLLNTNSDDEAVYELTHTVLSAPISSDNLSDGAGTLSLFAASLSSSSAPVANGWRAFSTTSLLMSVASFALIYNFL